MSYPVARAVVKCQINTSIQSSPTYPITLSGRGIGLKGLKVGVERDISEEDGYYQGIRDQNDTQRSTGTIEFMVRLVNATKVFVGKEGQFLHLQRELKDATGTTQITDKSVCMIKMCTPEEDGRGGFQIPVSGPMVADPAITVV